MVSYGGLKKEKSIMKMKNIQKLTLVIALLSHTAFASTSADYRLLDALNTANPSLATIQKLLTIPAVKDNINLQDSNSMTALMYAVSAANLPLTQALIAAGAKTTPPADQANNSDTALFIAVSQETPSLPIIKALLNAPDSKDSINIQDNTGYTALMYAVGGSNLHLTQLLVAAGAKTTPQANLADNGLATALIIAVTQQTPSLAIVTALLGAHDIKHSIDIQDSNGYTALMYAAQVGNFPIVQALLAAGAKTTPQASSAYHSRTALLCALTEPTPSLDIIDTLLKAPDIKDSINIQDNSGHTPLMWAANEGNLPIVQVLITTGADVTIATPQGQTALSLA